MKKDKIIKGIVIRIYESIYELLIFWRNIMKTQMPVMIDVELLKQVDDFLYENRMKNRSKFICSLIEDELAMKNENIKREM